METQRHYIFEDREHAGKLLANKLLNYKNESGVILAVPRGGIPVAYEVAKRIGYPVEILLTKKIGHPLNKEYAIGAATLTDYFITPEMKISEDYLEKELKFIRTKLKHMYDIFLGRKQPGQLAGKTVIVIDDGMASGSTLLGTVHIIKKSKPGKIIVAVPVASKESVEKLLKKVDEVITVMVPDEFNSVGAFYRNFEQVTEKDVLIYLNKLRVWRLY